MKLHDSVEVCLDLRGAGETQPEAVHVGSLRGTFIGGSRSLGALRFEYAAEYLANPRCIALSPNLPLVRGPKYLEVEDWLPDAFGDTAPDDWGQSVLRERAANEAPNMQLGQFDMLTLVDDDTRMGAIRYQDSEGEWLAKSERSQTVQSTDWKETVVRFVAASQRFEQWEATEADIELLEAAGSSLGGVRPKATLDRNGELWLLKLPSQKDREIDVEAWEAVAFALAESAGIRVASHTLVTGKKGKSALLIARFDRDGDRRLPYLSAMTLLEAGPHGAETYEDLADALVDLGAPTKDLHELFVRVAFNVLISNRDDHWRNHGFIYDGGWRLSPAFDLNPVRATSAIRSRRINLKDDPSRRQIVHLLAGCDAYALNETQAAELLKPLLGAVRDWPGVAARRGIHSAEIERMASAFPEDQFMAVEEFVRLHSA